MTKVARSIVSLNGRWQFQPSNNDSLPASWNHTAPVPALVDCAEPPCDWRAFSWFWYRTTFRSSMSHELAFIIIEQAMFGTEVWLNGKHLGGDIACYTSQEYDAREALKHGENELIVRVGTRQNLPAHSAVGNDQERSEWIPGVWGDVALIQCGNPRIKLIQIIPHIKTSTAEARVTVENRSPARVRVQLTTEVREKKSGKLASAHQQQKLTIEANSEAVAVFHHRLDSMQLWSPDSPFLYELEARIEPESRTLPVRQLGPNPKPHGDSCAATFGMREFAIVDGDFFLNGKKILLRGGNIAFHRFLSDADRRTLPWQPEWIKKVLIDIPKAHNFNFFRCHLGHMYNRWYDVADEHGMLLQDEWMFWTTTGTKDQITKEFTRWLQDNWNHPSIVIWDALNECTDPVVQREVVPDMKKLDPTRPWESVDFTEDHPYIYSLGPVLNDRRFGFTRALDEIERSLKPTVLNEFCWWWLDNEFKPTSLMKGVVERWLGPRWTQEELIAHQSFLATELVELFRRMRVDAIQPFVYLSNNAGPTAHWFVGDIKNLEPKPILAALKNAFSPFGVSIELWDRHFFPSEQRTVRVFLFNDSGDEQRGRFRCGVLNEHGEWWFDTQRDVHVPPMETLVLPATLPFPSREGTCRIRAELLQNGRCIAVSEKPAQIFAPPQVRRLVQEAVCALLSENDELQSFLADRGVHLCAFPDMRAHGAEVVIVGEGMLFSSEFQSRLGAVTKFLESGRSVIIVEPEFGVTERETVSVALGLELAIERREDKDKGGYDSYVFAADQSHPLWDGIRAEHLKMFNGAYGGEIVSQHDVRANKESLVLARCGLGLQVPAVFEIPYGRGKVIVSRLQLRGRLISGDQSGRLFARRPDPVLQRYLLNLLAYAIESRHD
jgi:hypothetical protein